MIYYLIFTIFIDYLIINYYKITKTNYLHYKYKKKYSNKIKIKENIEIEY